MEIRYKLKTKLQRFQKDNLEYVLKFDSQLSNINIKNDGQDLVVSFDAKCNEQVKKEEVLQVIKSYDLPIEFKNKILFINTNLNAKEKSETFFDELIEQKLIYKEMDGVYIFYGIVNKLYRALSNFFRKKCLKLGAEEVYIPSLLSKNTLEKTDYIIKNEKLCNFISHKTDKYGVDGILNPAACQPIYKTVGNINQPKILTGFARVYRYEGNNYKELSRLREYGIRELIYISDDKGVQRFKNKCMKVAKELIMRLNLTATIEIASDMFFESDFISKSIFQIASENKLEIRLKLAQDEYIAGGSLNVHNEFFSSRWGISYETQNASSFCMGLGIERWCYAVLCQYGYKEEKWPKELRSLIDYYAR